MAANGYAALVRNKKEKPKHRKLDDYETPELNTFQLANVVKFKGPILEPAAGSGRMVRALRKALRKRWGRMAADLSIVGCDIKEGKQFDFLKRTMKWKGDIVTNPPYGQGRADAFVDHALKLADGRVAMLVELKFLTGDRRAARLFRKYKPELVILIPERIYFFAGGKPIPAQFFNHCWIVWPPRSKRGPNVKCELLWADRPELDFG